MVGTVLLVLAVSAASAVEMVEALTIVLATGVTRGWRSALEGAAVALLALVALVVVFGTTLARFIPLDGLHLFVGTLLLIFGLQWLRKAILRASGYKALRDEELAYERQVQQLDTTQPIVRGRRDAFAFTVSFKGVFLEGLEVVMIVISFGASSGRLGLAALGAGIAVIVVGVAGTILARPLSRVPENAMKMVVGILLTTFGTFWAAEGAGIEWPAEDFFVVVLLVFYILVTLGLIRFLARTRAAELLRSEA